ncbi:MAG: ABC transporter ATP-binding protein/permease, partial [Rickettsiales bacterium]|nr:ABC transporter ATP-binding protein/permease [Rickettsiales bacterium]
MPKTLMGFYWEMLKRFRWYAIASTVTGFAWSVWTVAANPLINEKIYSIFDYDGPDFWGCAAGIIATVAALYFMPRPIRIVNEILNNKTRPRIGQKIRAELFDYIYSADYKFFLDKNVGQLQSQVENIYHNFHQLTINIATHFLGVLAGLAILFGMLGRIDMGAAWALTAYGVVTLAWTALAVRHSAKLKSVAVKVQSKLSGIISDSVLNFANVKIFASAPFEQKHVDKGRDEALQKGWRWSRFNLVNGSVFMWAFAILCFLGVVAYCMHSFHAGQMNVAGFALVISALSKFEFECGRLGRMITDAVEAYAGAKQAWDEIMVPAKIKDKAGAKDLAVTRGQVDMRGISFRYHKEWVVRDMSLKINPGEKIGIVGASGAGKTTLSQLILRLFDVQKGAIMIDGQDIKNVRQDSLRRQIAFVPQDPALFNRTIGENIAYARPDASKAEIEHAAKLA